MNGARSRLGCKSQETLFYHLTESGRVTEGGGATNKAVKICAKGSIGLGFGAQTWRCLSLLSVLELCKTFFLPRPRIQNRIILYDVRSGRAGCVRYAATATIHPLSVGRNWLQQLPPLNSLSLFINSGWTDYRYRRRPWAISIRSLRSSLILLELLFRARNKSIVEIRVATSLTRSGSIREKGAKDECMITATADSGWHS